MNETEGIGERLMKRKIDEEDWEPLLLRPLHVYETIDYMLEKNYT